MSRSNPTTEGTPNPCKYWLEWKKGQFVYYDKEAEKNVELGHKITFLVLDQLATVKGWHDASESGLYSNEIRDSRNETLNVRSFKGGEVVEGIYADIRDKVKSAGGNYVSSVYVAMKIDGELVIANIGFQRSALGAWSEFRKENQSDILNKAVTVTGKKKGKKGSITYEVPTFSIREVSEETNAEAVELDKQLQAYLEQYLAARPQQQQESSNDNTDDYPKKMVEDDLPASLLEEEDEGDSLPF